ncbi:MAG TPA: cytochrome c peroxidase [Xanthobacteraceae bacterium]
MRGRHLRTLAPLAALCAAMSGIGLTAYAAAIVGPPRTLEIFSTDRSPATGQPSADYRRPATIPFPKDNPYTVEKAVLGKKLFFDTRLSGANVLSCATCHNPAFGWGDGQPRGVGHAMRILGRRSPTIINTAWAQIFMWDGRAATLEQQALGPMRAEAEMNLPIEHLVERLSAIDQYRSLFAAAFPNEPIAADNIAKALATYERTVVSGWSPFDAWIEGDEAAIPESAKRGFVLFRTKAGCVECHRGWNFTEDSFHDVGLPSADIRRGAFVPGVVKLQHAFKTPGLRDIARRGPFMHDGSLATLEAVVDHYDQGGMIRPSQSELVKPLGLSAQEKADLIAFLETLTGNSNPTTIPVLPRRAANSHETR